MGKELTSILESEKMAHLLPNFSEQGITDDILTKLTDSDLKELGIHKFRHPDLREACTAFEEAQ